MIGLSPTPATTAALRQWRGRSLFPTDLTSAQLRSFSSQLRLRSVFAARMTNADACQSLAEIVDDLLSGKFALAEGRYRMMRVLQTLGYDPAKGFPQDMAAIPPADRDSLRDLSSEGRINLMLETNMRVSANFGMVEAGNSEYARRWYPAWELVRLYIRVIPRGTPESHSEGWKRRWEDAGQVVGFEGALENKMVALKDSPIWQALGDGEGGYDDTLGLPFPPFAFNSGMAFRPVSREECLVLGLIQSEEVPAPVSVSMVPKDASLHDYYNRLAPDLREALRKELLAA